MDKIESKRRKSYNLTYKREIAPFLHSLEKIRKIECIKGIFFTIILTLSSIGIVPLLIHTIMDMSKKNIKDYDIILYAIQNPALTLLLVITALALYFSFKKKREIEKNFSEKLKTNCEQQILSLFGDIKKVERCFDDNEIYSTELFQEYDRSEEDDAYILNHKGVNCKISELALQIFGQYRVRMITTFKYVESIIFKGILIKIDSNKRFIGRTTISKKGSRTKKFKYTIPLYLVIIASIIHFLYIYIGDIAIDDKTIETNLLFIFASAISIAILFAINYRHDKVVLEDIELMKYFNIESTDQIEARYLITPAFMQRFKELETVFGKKNIRCTFYNNSAFFAIETNKNLFELGSLYKSLTNKKRINDFYKQIEAIHNIIEHFKFDEKIY